MARKYVARTFLTTLDFCSRMIWGKILSSYICLETNVAMISYGKTVTTIALILSNPAPKDFKAPKGLLKSRATL